MGGAKPANLPAKSLHTVKIRATMFLSRNNRHRSFIFVSFAESKVFEGL
jgi:hypothetical protein